MSLALTVLPSLTKNSSSVVPFLSNCRAHSPDKSLQYNNTLLEKFWRISLHVTDDAIAKL